MAVRTRRLCKNHRRPKHCNGKGCVEFVVGGCKATCWACGGKFIEYEDGLRCSRCDLTIEEQLGFVNNLKAKDVTYSRVVDFLEQDKVKEHSYELGVYDCKHFACELHNNAEAVGIRCAVGWLQDRTHIFNVFRTIDRGMIFVDLGELRDVSDGESADFKIAW